MATKKQKRERGEKKRMHFMAEVKRTGLEAQRKDREYREQKNKEAWRDQHDKKHNWKRRIKECPLCQEITQGTSKAATTKELVKEII